MNRSDFGEDFQWGVSTAAYQTEGAHDVDGKGPSIWDVFTARKGNVKDNHHGRTACDFYACYKQDIDLIRQLNLPNFRFSLAWSRILPEGTGRVNQEGIDHYNRLIDYVLECGITPWLTLYHWDLPYALELKGGWRNRDIVNWFAEYATLCAKEFGDRVKNWIVMNEPSVFTGAGYFLGIHAPGKKGLKNFLPAMHHVTMATGAGARALRAYVPDGNIGTTFSCTLIESYSQSKRDLAAANRIDTLVNRAFLEPLLGLGYPEKDLPVLGKLKKYIKPEDEALMKFDFDFIGLQNYTREIVKSSFFIPYLGARVVKAEKRGVPITDMKWEVYPQAMYEMIKKFNGYTQIKKLLITENGAAFPDSLNNGKVEDTRRVEYLQENLKQLLKAKKEGYNVDGYFVWTLTDNFEWAEGYHPRFGLIYIDFDTQERTVKESGRWLKEFLARK